MIKAEELEKIIEKYKELESKLNESIKDQDEFIRVSKGF